MSIAMACNSIMPAVNPCGHSFQLFKLEMAECSRTTMVFIINIVCITVME